MTPAPFVVVGTPPTADAADTPSPVDEGVVTPSPSVDGTTPGPMEVGTGSIGGTFIGCFLDMSAARIMTMAAAQTPMGSDVSLSLIHI